MWNIFRWPKEADLKRETQVTPDQRVGWLITYVDDLMTITQEDYGRKVLKAVGDRWKCSAMQSLDPGQEIQFLGLRIF